MAQILLFPFVYGKTEQERFDSFLRALAAVMRGDDGKPPVQTCGCDDCMKYIYAAEAAERQNDGKK